MFWSFSALHCESRRAAVSTRGPRPLKEQSVLWSFVSCWDNMGLISCVAGTNNSLGEMLQGLINNIAVVHEILISKFSPLWSRFSCRRSTGEFEHPNTRRSNRRLLLIELLCKNVNEILKEFVSSKHFVWSSMFGVLDFWIHLQPAFINNGPVCRSDLQGQRRWIQRSLIGFARSLMFFHLNYVNVVLKILLWHY